MRTWFRFLTALALLGAIAGTAAAQDSVKVLVLVGGAYHDYEKLPKTLTETLTSRLKERSIPAEFHITSDLNELRKSELARYDALMMNVCEQTPVSAEAQQGFLDAVKNGMPVVALHCTFWSFQQWPEFKNVLGAFVPGHGHFGTFCLKTLKPGSPILSGVPPEFELTDEPYIVNDRDPSIQPIVETCESVENRSGSEPEVWTKLYGKGRVFAMTFGHDARAQSDPNYQTLLVNGLLWALGRSQ